jgi:hypothetical protein
VEFIIEL